MGLSQRIKIKRRNPLEVLEKIKKQRELREKACLKWKPFLDDLMNGKSNEQKNWLEEYSSFSSFERQDLGDRPIENNWNEQQESLLPLAVQVVAKTVGLDLVSVVPMGEVFDEEAYTNERRKTILGNMIDDVETDYEKLEDMKKDFKTGSSPSGTLFYMDYVYDSKK